MESEFSKCLNIHTLAAIKSFNLKLMKQASHIGHTLTFPSL